MGLGGILAWVTRGGTCGSGCLFGSWGMPPTVLAGMGQLLQWVDAHGLCAYGRVAALQGWEGLG